MDKKISISGLSAMIALATGRSGELCEEFLKELFNIVAGELERGESVRIKGLGTFKISDIEARKSVDIATGDEIEIPAHKRVVFVASKELATLVNFPFDAFEAVEVAEELSTDELEKVIPAENQYFNDIPQDSERIKMPVASETDEDFEPNFSEMEEEFANVEPGDGDIELDIIESEVNEIGDDENRFVESGEDKIEIAESEDADLDIADSGDNKADVSEEDSTISEPEEDSATAELVKDFAIVKPEDEEKIDLAEIENEVKIDLNKTDIQAEYSDTDPLMDLTEDSVEEKPEIFEKPSDSELLDDAESPESLEPIKHIRFNATDYEGEEEEIEEDEKKHRGRFGKGFFAGFLVAISFFAVVLLVALKYGYLEIGEKGLELRGKDITGLSSLGKQEDPGNNLADSSFLDSTGTSDVNDETGASVYSGEDVPTEASDVAVYDVVSTTRYLTTMAKEHYGNFNLWPIIYEENKAILGHPDRIKPGTQVVVPPLSKYHINPDNEEDVKKIKQKGVEIYARYR